MSYTALEIAKYVIDKCTREGHPISNLQLQKILYYIQKAFLENGTEAFEDDIEAWQFGPVVPSVYYQYCGFGAMAIRMKYETSIREAFLKIIAPIVEVKRDLNPWIMVEDTHKDGKAWAEIYKDGIGNHQVIPKELIRRKG